MAIVLVFSVTATPGRTSIRSEEVAKTAKLPAAQGVPSADARQARRFAAAMLGREQTMEPGIDYSKHAPEAQKAMLALGKYIFSSGLDHKLIHLMKLRASQINGCAFCIDMHSKDARALGETEQRRYTLAAWRETPFFTEPERAALEWTEWLTLVSRLTCRMRTTKRCVNTSAKRKSSI